MRRETESDELLVEGCLKGRPSAQHSIYNRYGPFTYGICRRYSADSMEAEDLHQVGWMRAFDKIATYKNDGPLGAWLRKLFVHVCLNAWQKRKNQLRWLSAETDNPNAREVSDPTPPSDFLQLEQLTQLISALPEGARLVFNLFAVEGMNHKEIAAHLNISEETSRQQLRRARLQLAKNLPATTKALYQNNSHQTT